MFTLGCFNLTSRALVHAHHCTVRTARFSGGKRSFCIEAFGKSRIASTHTTCSVFDATSAHSLAADVSAAASMSCCAIWRTTCDNAQGGHRHQHHCCTSNSSSSVQQLPARVLLQELLQSATDCWLRRGGRVRQRRRWRRRRRRVTHAPSHGCAAGTAMSSRKHQ